MMTDFLRNIFNTNILASSLVDGSPRTPDNVKQMKEKIKKFAFSDSNGIESFFSDDIIRDYLDYASQHKFGPETDNIRKFYAFIHNPKLLLSFDVVIHRKQKDTYKNFFDFTDGFDNYNILLYLIKDTLKNSIFLNEQNQGEHINTLSKHIMEVLTEIYNKKISKDSISITMNNAKLDSKSIIKLALILGEIINNHKNYVNNNKQNASERNYIVNNLKENIQNGKNIDITFTNEQKTLTINNQTYNFNLAYNGIEQKFNIHDYSKMFKNKSIQNGPTMIQSSTTKDTTPIKANSTVGTSDTRTSTSGPSTSGPSTSGNATNVTSTVGTPTSVNSSTITPTPQNNVNKALTDSKIALQNTSNIKNSSSSSSITSTKDTINNKNISQPSTLTNNNDTKKINNINNESKDPNSILKNATLLTGGAGLGYVATSLGEKKPSKTDNNNNTLEATDEYEKLNNKNKTKELDGDYDNYDDINEEEEEEEEEKDYNN